MQRPRDPAYGDAMKISHLLMLSASAATPLIGASPAAPGKDVSVPFANDGNIDDFRSDGDEAVYLEVNGFDWYHAQLLGSCNRLPYAQHIAVETRGTGTLDKFATLIVDGQRCPLTSLVRSAPPPKSPDKRHSSQP